MDFVALDFETANASMASICQIGAVEFCGGMPTDRFTTLVDPEDDFDAMNVSIHWIDEAAVKGAPTLPNLFERLACILTDRIVVAHTHFDRVALTQATAKYGLPPIRCRWLDSAKIVKRTWVECARSGYGLAQVAEKLGIEFRHHDAGADAEVCGKILVRAIDESDIDIDGWLLRSVFPLGEIIHGPLKRDGEPGGPLAGECVVFTGAMQIPRHEAAAMAARVGCSVAAAVSKKISMLVVGDQDIMKLRPGETRSSKQILAAKLIAEGHAIRILGETDFMMLCKLEQADAAGAVTAGPLIVSAYTAA